MNCFEILGGQSELLEGIVARGGFQDGRDEGEGSEPPSTFSKHIFHHDATLSRNIITETYQFTSYKYLNMPVFVEKPLSLSANAKYKYINIFLIYIYIHNKKYVLFIYLLPNTCVYDLSLSKLMTKFQLRIF